MLRGRLDRFSAPVLFQHRFAADDLRARLFQQELHAAHQLGRDLALALLDLLEAEAAGVAEDVLLHQCADLLHGVGLVHQILGGDAAHVQAGAAQVLLFKQGHLHALLGGGNAQGVAAGAAADHQYIILFHDLLPHQYSISAGASISVFSSWRNCAP